MRKINLVTLLPHHIYTRCTFNLISGLTDVPLPPSFCPPKPTLTPSHHLESVAVSGVQGKVSHLFGGPTLGWIIHNPVFLWWSQRRAPGQVHALGGHSRYFQVSWAELGTRAHRGVFHSAAWELKTQLFSYIRTSHAKHTFQLINMSDIFQIKLQSPSL